MTKLPLSHLNWATDIQQHELTTNHEVLELLFGREIPGLQYKYTLYSLNFLPLSVGFSGDSGIARLRRTAFQ